MPAGQGKDAERFAAAVESGTPLGPADDADLARELEIVAMLRSRGTAFAPDADTKARAKQRLMAVLAEQGGPRPVPRPVAEPPAAAELTAPLGRLAEREDLDPTAQTMRMEPIAGEAPAGAVSGDEPGADADTESDTVVEPIPLRGGRGSRRARHSLGGRARRSARAGLRGRVVFVGAAAAAAMLAIASGGVLASSDSLPGDSLYPVKRVAESAGLAMTFDDASRARRYLEIAAIRLSEVEQLARNAQTELGPEVFTATMGDFDTSTGEGSRLLLEAAESDEASTAADDLYTWATTQSERLTELEPELPAGADAGHSIELLEQLLGRTGDRSGGATCDEDDCDSDRSSDESSSGSDATDTTTKDATSTPDEDDSEDASETSTPSRTPSETSDRDSPGLLPDLVPDATKEDEGDKESSSSDDEETTSTSKSKSKSDDEGDDNVSVPLPLLPPVTLPPLLPGMPGITIG